MDLYSDEFLEKVLGLDPNDPKNYDNEDVNQVFG